MITICYQGGENCGSSEEDRPEHCDVRESGASAEDQVFSPLSGSGGCEGSRGVYIWTRAQYLLILLQSTI